MSSLSKFEKVIESLVERIIIAPLRGRARPGEIAKRRLRQIDHHPSGRLDQRSASNWVVEFNQLATRLPLGTVVVGRSVDADLVLPDPTVSRMHAELHVSENGVTIRDLDSRFGTFLNDTRVGLADGLANDRLRFGEASTYLRNISK